MREAAWISWLQEEMMDLLIWTDSESFPLRATQGQRPAFLLGSDREPPRAVTARTYHFQSLPG